MSKLAFLNASFDIDIFEMVLCREGYVWSVSLVQGCVASMVGVVIFVDSSCSPSNSISGKQSKSNQNDHVILRKNAPRI
jgi:hypothetical protein